MPTSGLIVMRANETEPSLRPPGYHLSGSFWVSVMV